MKYRTLILITVVNLIPALALPVQLAAQHTQYKVIDIGTLGGPADSYEQGNGPGTSQTLNNAGVVAGTADTSTPDPTCGQPGLLRQRRLSMAGRCSYRSRYASGRQLQRR